MAKNGGSGRIGAGATITRRRFTAVSGETIPIPDADRLVHLQFRRFAGCPVCNLHLRSVAARHDEIAAAGVREVVVFHSSAEALRPHTAELPFAVVADPDKRLYREFGVESAFRALLDPRVWGRVVYGVLRDLGPVLRGRRKSPSFTPEGGRLGLPADFLIAADGRVVAVKYGDHAYDQWPVDEILALARAEREDPARI
ncbi:peroxiredoxin-like family protein [Microtetraspora malaysiensis]|uniref:peroxiredoxin-like family protein n=1 Tax=Microtetraspora malaysiensis TaxID=161358 RepID=UPI003D8C1D15